MLFLLATPTLCWPRAYFKIFYPLNNKLCRKVIRIAIDELSKKIYVELASGDSLVVSMTRENVPQTALIAGSQNGSPSQRSTDIGHSFSYRCNIE